MLKSSAIWMLPHPARSATPSRWLRSPSLVAPAALGSTAPWKPAQGLLRDRRVKIYGLIERDPLAAPAPVSGGSQTLDGDRLIFTPRQMRVAPQEQFERAQSRLSTRMTPAPREPLAP